MELWICLKEYIPSLVQIDYNSLPYSKLKQTKIENFIIKSAKLLIMKGLELYDIPILGLLNFI